MGFRDFAGERYVDLSEHIKNDLDIELLKRTPSAYLGSCRFKLPEISEDRAIYDRILKFWMAWKWNISFTSAEMIPWIP